MIIPASSILRAGVEDALAHTWQVGYPIYYERQKLFFHYLPWTNKRFAPYVFLDRVPMPKPWPYGKPRTRQTMRDREITIGLFPYDLTILWSGWDREDSQVGKDYIRTHVGLGLDRFWQIPDILYTEYLTGVPSYNKSLALAYDGVPLFSAVDGNGADRFGVVGGNILIGTGVSNVAKLKTDIVSVRQRFLNMKEPETGQPLFSADDIAYGKFIFEIPANLDGLFQAISEQDLIYADPTINTAQSNFLKSRVKYFVNQRLTDASTWYVSVVHSVWKPFAFRSPQKDQIRTIYSEMQNSDEAREYNREGSFQDARMGLGPWAAFCMQKVAS